MVTCAEFWAGLTAPFPVEAVSWRVGATNEKYKKENEPLKGRALAYIDARDVMERLDSVLGPAGWGNSYSHAGAKTVCDIRCFVPMGAPHEDIANCTWDWVTKADGAGDTDYEAEKGALSDAFKRAAVRFGIGRYLYGLVSPYVEIEARGKSKVLTKESYKSLEKYLRDSTPNGAGNNQERTALRLLCYAVEALGDKDAILNFKEQRKAEISKLSIANQEAFNNFVTGRINILNTQAEAAQ